MQRHAANACHATRQGPAGRRVHACFRSRSGAACLAEGLTWTPPLTPRPRQAVTLADFGAPGAGLPGIHTLRSVGDADALLADVAALKAAGGGQARRRGRCACCLWLLRRAARAHSLANPASAQPRALPSQDPNP